MTDAYEFLVGPSVDALQAELLGRIADLARELAPRETAIDEVDEREQTRQYHIELYHRHLPKLADDGYVTFDRDRRTVALDANVADGASDEAKTLHL